MQTKEKTIKVSLTLDSTKWERLKKIAKHKESTASQEFRKMLNEYLMKNSQLDLF